MQTQGGGCQCGKVRYEVQVAIDEVRGGIEVRGLKMRKVDGRSRRARSMRRRRFKGR